MKIVSIRLALALALISVAGCSFRPYLRDSRDPAITALPPCYSGDVCATAPDSFGWAVDVLQSRR